MVSPNSPDGTRVCGQALGLSALSVPLLPKPRYRDVLEQVLAETKGFAGEVLLVHGDSHIHRIDQPLLDPLNNKVVKNFTRLETFGSPFMGWIKVDVEPGGKPLFSYTPRAYSPKGGN
jgi:hypothetical protein